jgi:hypothetical protein
MQKTIHYDDCVSDDVISAILKKAFEKGLSVMNVHTDLVLRGPKAEVEEVVQYASELLSDSNHPGPCPECGGIKVRREHSPCLCRCPIESSCWTYPICVTCGYTTGHASANSGGGTWESFV